jgi:hypothetical protein
MSGPPLPYDHEAAKETYASLLALNPHLPPMAYVLPNDLELKFGQDEFATLRLSVYVTLPKPQESTDEPVPDE